MRCGKLTNCWESLNEKSRPGRLAKGQGSNPISNHIRTTPNTTPPTAGTFIAQGVGIQCVYCKGQHYSASCDKVQDVKARKNLLLKSGRCFNCLKGNHKLRECRSPKTCRNCHQRHHQSICSGLSAEAEPFIPQSKANNPVTNDTNGTITSTSSSNTTNTSESKGNILLQTAQAIACDEASQRLARVRVLFDCGSQRSYVTESLCSKLELSPVRSERLHLNTFGEAQHKPKNCKLFNCAWVNWAHPTEQRSLLSVFPSFVLPCLLFQTLASMYTYQVWS